MANRKRKSSAILRASDGMGGLRNVADHRFKRGAWPIQRIVAARDASSWMAHLSVEMTHRGWSASGMEQLNAQSNSGSKTIHLAAGPEAAAIEIAWNKARGGILQVKARPSKAPPADLQLVQDFFGTLDNRVAKELLDQAHRRFWLTYRGLPWKGELWLGPTLRLGPPSRFADSLDGEQVVLIDTIATGIGAQGIRENFFNVLKEIALILSPILGIHLRLAPQWESRWVVDIDAAGKMTDCRLGHVGYTELESSSGMPSIGQAPTITVEAVSRPGLGRQGIWPGDVDERVPGDLIALWNAFQALPSKLRLQYLNACNAYAIAQSMWPDQRTAYAVFLVIACEALKPSSKKYDGANLYDVVASLLDRATAQKLKSHRLAPYKVRSQHVHRGALAADELSTWMNADRFMDPSFDDMVRALSVTVRICMIEWLRRGGNYPLTWMPRPKASRRP